MKDKRSGIVIFFISLWLLLLIFVAYVSPCYLSQELFVGSRNNFNERLPRWLYDDRIPRFVWMWANLDGNHYVSIARDGYYQREHGFFPLYPVAIHIVEHITSLPYIVCGLFISYFSFCGFLKLLFELIKKMSIPVGSLQLLCWLITFPTAFFLISVYNDSLYLFLAVAAFYAISKKHWARACLLTYLAGLTRITALALFPALVVEGFQSKKNRLAIWIAAIFAPLGFLTYLGYLEIFVGGWNAFFDSMAVWGQGKFVFPLQTFWRYTKILVTYHHSDRFFLVAGIELFLMIFAALLLFIGRKMIRKSLWVYTLFVIILPSTSGTISGFPRYFLHGFPLLLILALIFRKNSPMTIAIEITFLAIQVVFFAFFSQGYFVS